MRMPDHLSCLLRNLYACQEAAVWIGHETMDWFLIEKGLRQGCILSPCLFNLYAEYIMWNAGLDEAQAGINIAGRNINKLRYADDTTFIAGSGEDLKSLLMKMKRRVKKLASSSTFRKLRSWHLVPSLHGKQVGKQRKQWETFFYWGSKITADGDCSHEIKRHFLLGREGIASLDSLDIKKQRHYFTDKGPSSQSYGFSSSCVRMWELDYKESWVPKNGCFWTVVLEKTLQSPMDCTEKGINPKGNQSWIFIGRTGIEAETPILWLPDAKNQLIGKDPDAGKDWRQKEKGTTEDEIVEWHHRLDGPQFEQSSGVGDGQVSLACCSPWGHRESDMTELLNQTEANSEDNSLQLRHIKICCILTVNKSTVYLLE